MNYPALSTETAAQTVTTEAHSGALAAWLDYALTGCLVLLALAAPLSIAATQTAWLLGLVVWALRLCVRPRPRLRRTPVDYALLGFFILTFFSALVSYDPDVSIGKLRAASLFTIVYLVAENVRTRRTLRALTLILVASATVSAAYAFIHYARGRGVQIKTLTADSPLTRAVPNYGETLHAGDTLLTVDGVRVNNPAELARALAAPADATETRLTFYRREWYYEARMPRGALLAGATPEARLGLQAWTRGRDERATGFYGQYVTYAEALQLLTSLAVGLFIALDRKRSRRGLLVALAIIGLSLALLLTVTRASWLALLVSVGVMALARAGRRRALVVVALGALLVAPLGLYVLRQKRQVGFFDRNDGSTTWRMTVWREGTRLLVSRPRHLLVGIGMDTIKRHWRAWGLFDGGRLPWGHMHSTPLQLALERGLPALAAWLALLLIYARTLWRLARVPGRTDWIERGLALGALGGACGFFTSGLVHYNLGDSEVAMIFYLVMGLALACSRLASERPPENAPAATT
jgi:O-antigen ligase